MKIQCDVCEKAPATLICCADEAALCSRCDVEVHAANKLASKHQRLLLHHHTLSNKLPTCDICQEKTAFIFCVEDRALFCRDCDEPIHSAGSLAANHQRFLATGIRVAVANSGLEVDVDGGIDRRREPPLPPLPVVEAKEVKTLPVNGCGSPVWAVDDFLQFSDFDTSDKKEQLEFGELEWLTDYDVFGDTTAEVPQLPPSQPINNGLYRQPKYATSNKKPRYELPYIEDDDEHNFTVPDLG